ncbi:uncharacterized protein GIQ15_01772 [Arthroderma uncinatum]|uniref:uncharacterized protein n=1 Tax=Arthroderma uncinatum TaxID=74035 RepID=UPI00144A56A3|nr:uncharacterized protein GIQ15_01772 [Arthroderma uncinatum]KAF3492255.1 hypothetical protein GIQ15_01772 [Arthroderma uncinatum]
MGIVSPMRVYIGDGVELDQNSAFRAVRSYFQREDIQKFCPAHELNITDYEKENFELHRDILHAVFIPLRRLLHQAAKVASLALPDYLGADLELAFRGEGRNAFVWLSSIITEEPNWCTTKGCPACTVLHIFHSEPLIRIVAVGCRVSNYLSLVRLVSPRHQLPNFHFWLTALASAVIEDDFWGIEHWLDIDHRAVYMDLSTRELIRQCLEIRDADCTIPHRPLHYDAGFTSDGRPRVDLGTTPPTLYTPVRKIDSAKWEELVRMARGKHSCSRLLSRHEGQRYSRRMHNRNTAITP